MKLKSHCKNGHARTPDNVDSSGACRICKRENAVKNYDPDKQKVKTDQRKAENPEKFKEYEERYFSKNADKVRERHRNWKKNNRDLVQFHLAKRRAAKLNRTPNWLSEVQKAEIRDFYLSANLLEQITGEKYQVDHIVPLQHPAVSGLHVPWNLQIITALHNQQKRNSFVPGQS